jgi:hypothetical protein
MDHRSEALRQLVMFMGFTRAVKILTDPERGLTPRDLAEIMRLARNYREESQPAWS